MIANKYIKILIFDILFCTTCSVVVGKYEKCDSYQKLKPLEQFVISSTVPGYLNGVECRWTVEAFPGYTLSLNCYDVRIPFSIACFNSQMLVSTTGRADLYDANRYCGNTPFQVESLSTRMTISLKRTPTSRDVNVRCIVRSIKTFCTCGSKNRGKIVGGSNTFPNEYPSMAGLVDFKERRIFCGATIISSAYALTAAHCKINRALTDLGLTVGEHDIKTGKDSEFTSLLRISEYLTHPGFNVHTNEHDIALVRILTPLTFTKGVSASCLPFRFKDDESFHSRNVQAVGWGSTEFAGPQSNVLQHVTLKIVSYGNCTKNQLCSYGKNKDTCQSDSGGPIYLFENKILYIIGIVSHGFECATNEPAVNTKVSSYLDWIIENTPKTSSYCIL